MKQVKILCGISGSGKSTLAGEMMLKAVNDGHQIACCSADKYFFDLDGNYKFDPSKIGDAHGACLREFTNYVHNNYEGLIIVDNTNTTVAEIAPYAALALANGYKLDIIIFQVVDSGGTLERIAARNIHNVSEKTVVAQWRRMVGLVSKLPPWWPVQVEKIAI